MDFINELIDEGGNFGKASDYDINGVKQKKKQKRQKRPVRESIDYSYSKRFDINIEEELVFALLNEIVWEKLVRNNIIKEYDSSVDGWEELSSKLDDPETITVFTTHDEAFNLVITKDNRMFEWDSGEINEVKPIDPQLIVRALKRELYKWFNNQITVTS